MVLIDEDICWIWNLLHIRYLTEDQAKKKSTDKAVTQLFSWN